MLSDVVLARTSVNIRHFFAEWQSEIPMRIHSGGLDRGGGPAWDGEFAHWLLKDERRQRDEDHPETRLRLVRAMRMLRKVAPREHDVVWKVFAGDSPSQINAWLNERAERLGHPERFTMKDTVVLIVSGIDKLAYWR
jgi:hypothetical protein